MAIPRSTVEMNEQAAEAEQAALGSMRGMDPNVNTYFPPEALLKRAKYLPLRVWQVKIVLQSPMLGTVPAKAAVYTDYIMKQAAEMGVSPEQLDLERSLFPTRERVEAASAEKMVHLTVDREGHTTFLMKDDGTPCISRHMISGFLKNGARAINRTAEESDLPSEAITPKLRAFLQIITQNIFVDPRFIDLIVPEGSMITINERPLQASTPQGQRTSLNSSDQVPIGTTMDFRIITMDNAEIVKKCKSSMGAWLDELLGYGFFLGLGQWRSSGLGQFEFSLRELPRDEWVWGY